MKLFMKVLAKNTMHLKIKYLRFLFVEIFSLHFSVLEKVRIKPFRIQHEHIYIYTDPVRYRMSGL